MAGMLSTFSLLYLNCIIFTTLLCLQKSMAQVPPTAILAPPPSPSQFSAPPTSSPPPLPPAPPAIALCNLTQIIRDAGRFSTFLQLLNETRALDKFQAQANRTDVGITVFVPTDDAFTLEPAATLLKNLTAEQKVPLAYFHALTKWFSLSELQNVNNMMISTFATYNDNTSGKKYSVNVTNFNGTLSMQTAWSNASITSTPYNAQPCSIYSVNQVLLSVDIFGMPPSAGGGSVNSTNSTAPRPSPPSPPSSGTAKTLYSAVAASIMVLICSFELLVF
ncbi:hypothetical protein KP509_38G066200 [Ceratopteris richardii]|uniref:FAS1 domain-containing protein n=1 Tax=Ceratopteris richardii TaxID=49495 RepID=A0A8T2Q5H2_CERRI|nr:hypothetical protein KP509_38G066200 [Ceratopteris richardii]